MGRKAINPIGQCFDSTAHQVLDWVLKKRVAGKVCHGIGVATMPGQEGNVIKHAWIEENGFAYDTTWGVRVPADEYRAGLGLSYFVEYSIADFMLNWLMNDFPGPWDSKIEAAGQPYKT